MSDEVLLTEQGSKLVRRDGAEVVLRGIGLGGWMNMANSITGHPATESQHRRVRHRCVRREPLIEIRARSPRT